jgi:hypothetical protein
MSELMGKRFCGGEGQVPEGRRGLGFSWADVVSRAAAPAKLRQERHVYSTLPAKDSSPGLWPVVSSQTCNPEGCQKVAGGRGAAQTRQAEMKPPRSNPKGVVQQSPGLARRQPWVIARQGPSTPTGLQPGGRKTSRLRSPPATTPLGLMAPPSPLPRVVPSVQPWALLHNRVAVEAAHHLCSRPLLVDFHL